MSLYVDPDALAARLPTDAFTSDQLVDFVTRASAYVDDGLPNYWPFPDYNATVATPQTIRDCALDYAVYLALGDLGEDNEQSEDTAPQARVERCDRILRELRQGPPSGRQVAQVQITSEVLTFGSDADHPDWAFLANVECEVIPESAEIAAASGTTMEVGTDFVIARSPGKRRWYVQRLNSEIVDDDLINYRISYVRAIERVGSLAPRGGTVSRG